MRAHRSPLTHVSQRRDLTAQWGRSRVDWGVDEARLGDVEGKGTAEYRNQPGGERLIFGLFEGNGDKVGDRLRAMAEARQPVRFEGVARDHARRYRVVVTVLIFRLGGSTALFRATGAPEEYSLIG